jgi:hypothetical protein
MGGEMVEQAIYRHELKFELNMMDACLLRSRLRRLMRLDAHARADGTYAVRSLYFDTPDSQALRDKLNGVDRRSKFRLRLYNHDSSLIKLEKKIKDGGATAKRSLPVKPEQCQRLLQGDLAWLLQSEEPLLQELYAEMQCNLLRPRVIIDYTREAYALKACAVRITLDSGIRTGGNSLDLLNPRLPTFGVPPLQRIILEVKYGSFLPEMLTHALQLGSRERGALSKYAVCRTFC